MHASSPMRLKDRNLLKKNTTKTTHDLINGRPQALLSKLKKRRIILSKKPEAIVEITKVISKIAGPLV